MCCGGRRRQNGDEAIRFDVIENDYNHYKLYDIPDTTLKTPSKGWVGRIIVGSLVEPKA